MVAQVVRRFGDRISFIGMAGRDDPALMPEFVDRYGLESIPHTIDRDGSLWARQGIAYQPAWIFVGHDGSVEVVPGSIEADELAATLQDLIRT
ncbi:MAG: hypothetical protein ACRDI0_12550 [Actinomycetota bacterium]